MAYSNVSCISLDLREKKNLFKFIKVILTAVEDNVQEVQGVLQDLPLRRTCQRAPAIV